LQQLAQELTASSRGAEKPGSRENATLSAAEDNRLKMDLIRAPK
jgi:hypothetical protein